jgi:hypothetical protein
MKKCVAMLTTAIVLLSGVTVSGREPVESEWLPFPPPVAPAPDPFAFTVPAGLYYVTDTYVADVVATVDTTTTYSTTTAHVSTGTYARVVDTVDTGASSAFDGMAFNGRGALTDGRGLAGTYYENFVLTATGYIPVSVVFFQDDSETRRRGSASTPAPASTPPATSTRPATAPAVPPAGPGSVTPPSPSFRPEPPVAPAAPTLRAGIALAPEGPTLASAEVLRGRLIRFWPRAFANNVSVPIRSWRLLPPEPDRISGDAGSTEPLEAQWIRMLAPGARASLRFEIFTELAPTERLEAQMTITVRSPALIE